MCTWLGQALGASVFDLGRSPRDDEERVEKKGVHVDLMKHICERIAGRATLNCFPKQGGIKGLD